MRSLYADEYWRSGGPKTLHTNNVQRLPLGAVDDGTLKTIIIFILLLVIDRPLVQYNVTLPTCI